MKSYSSENNQMGSIKYNEDVIRAMVGMALNEVEGVSGLEGKGGGGLLARKNYSHIGKIAMEEGQVVIDLSLVINYGLDLREKAREVQQKVYASIESMTDLKIKSVNVVVAGLEFAD